MKLSIRREGLERFVETYLGKINNLDYKSIRYPAIVILCVFFLKTFVFQKNRKSWWLFLIEHCRFAHKMNVLSLSGTRIEK